jgi:hypothetical protein
LRTSAIRQSHSQGGAERVARAFGEFDVEGVAGRATVGDLIDAD